MNELWGVILPSGLALAGVGLTALVSHRKNGGDVQLQLLAVLQAERITADARADKAEARADRESRRAKRWETFAWRLFQLLLRAGVEAPEWPTEETAKVTA